MPNYEYKTITIDSPLQGKGLGSSSARSLPELDEVLNREGGDGWRLREVVFPPKGWGETTRAIVVFEKEKA